MGLICCICGKRIQDWMSDYPLSKDFMDDRVCGDCQEKLDHIKDVKTKKEALEEIEFFDICMSKEQMKPEAKNFLNTIISAFSEISGGKSVNDFLSQKAETLLDNLLLTSGFNFEGYRIEKYHGFLSAETALGIGMFKAIAASLSNTFGEEDEALKFKLAEAKAIVFKDLKQQVVSAGANAIIGLALNYTMFGDTIVGVIISGTAVSIMKL